MYYSQNFIASLIVHLDRFGAETCPIVMDYIEGKNLDYCWQSLDEETRADVADQVAVGNW